MKASLAPVLLFALLAPIARADLLVTPTHAAGAYQFVDSFGAFPPDEGDRSREATSPSAFASSGSSQFGQDPGSIAGAGAGFNDTFFFVFPNIVNQAGISGTAHARAQVADSGPGLMQGVATSNATVEFDVTHEVLFNLSGALTIAGVANTGSGSLIAIISLELLRDNLPYAGISASLTLPQNAMIPLSQTGTLQPGHYVLAGYATAAASSSTPGSNWSGDASFSATLTFAAIPEPALALPLGLALLARRRRR